MRFSLLQTLSTVPHAFLDVETTGASADFGHRVIELGIVRYEGGQKVAEYQQLIDPRRPISAGITALTGISPTMVRGMPTFAEQLPSAMQLLDGAAILGHNVRFDLSFLRKEFRTGGKEITEALGEVPVLDTVRIARRRFGRGGNGLQNLASRMGFTPPAAHRALADAQTTAWVYEVLMHPIGGWNTSLLDAVRAQGGPMSLLPANPRESLLPLELEEAIEQKMPVRMEYLDARQARTFRVIQPLTIRRSSGELLLVAHCHLRNEQRTFKIERVVKFWRLESEPTPTAPAGSALSSVTLFDALEVATPIQEPPPLPVPSVPGEAPAGGASTLVESTPAERVESSHGQIASVIEYPAPGHATRGEIPTDPGPDRDATIDPGGLRQPAPRPAVSD